MSVGVFCVHIKKIAINKHPATEKIVLNCEKLDDGW